MEKAFLKTLLGREKNAGNNSVFLKAIYTLSKTQVII